MEKVALYRKYRPHNFDNFVGQDHIKNTLINAIKNDAVSHAYLFTGPRGTGKTSAARLVAKALCCSNLKDGYEPCNECELCKDINEGRLIDLIEVDAASNRGIDEVRDLREKIGFAPTRAKRKIYIIDEVHMMTKEAFNALLKTLEEPPDHAYFILATTEVHKIPETIISRCQRFDFRRINKRSLMTRLSFIAQKEGIKADDTALELISRYVEGGLRDAIGLIEQLTVKGELKYEYVQDILGVSDLSLLENLYEYLIKRDTGAAMGVIHELHSQGSDFKQFIHEFVDMVREKMVAMIQDDKVEKIGQMVKIIETFQEAKENYDESIPQLALEIAIVKLTTDFDTVSLEITEEEVAARLPEMLDQKDDLEEKEVTAVPNEEPGINKHEDDEDQSVKDFPALTISHLKEKWPRIVERLKRPALKMSVKDAVPAMVDEFKVTLEFGTKFHKDKVIEHDNRVELEDVIRQVFGQDVKINAILKEMEMKSMVENDGSNDEVDDENSDDLADQALEIFGGELVEE